MDLCFVDHVPFGEVTLAPPSLTSKPKKAPIKSQVNCNGGMTCYRNALIASKWCQLVSLLYLQPPESTKGAASQLAPRTHGDLHNQAVHGQKEDHGGGEGARSGGVPLSQETETAAARGQEGRSGKTEEPSVRSCVPRLKEL